MYIEIHVNIYISPGRLTCFIKHKYQRITVIYTLIINYQAIWEAIYRTSCFTICSRYA